MISALLSFRGAKCELSWWCEVYDGRKSDETLSVTFRVRLRLHDTGMKFCIGMEIYMRFEMLLWCHVNKYRPKSGNRYDFAPA